MVLSCGHGVEALVLAILDGDPALYKVGRWLKERSRVSLLQPGLMRASLNDYRLGHIPLAAAASRPASRGMWWSAARHQEPVLSGRPWPPGGLPAAAATSGSPHAPVRQGFPVARGEKGTPWRVHQREQGDTGWGTRAVEKAV